MNLFNENTNWKPFNGIEKSFRSKKTQSIISDFHLRTASMQSISSDIEKNQLFKFR